MAKAMVNCTCKKCGREFTRTKTCYNRQEADSMVKRSWKVYGMFDGEIRHRQKESFCESYKYDFSKGNNIRIIEVENSDITGTNDYAIIRITRNTAKECKDELDGQISDGIFENSRTGDIEEI